MVGVNAPEKSQPDLDKLARPPELDDVTVEYEEGRRFVNCFCGTRLSRSIVPHLKSVHAAKWRDWTARFIKLRGHGYPLKRIMRLFSARDGVLLFSWTVIERAIRSAVESGTLPYSPPPKKAVARWEPDNFTLQNTTLWDFPRRGDWAVHSGDYRGNWPPEIPRNLILRYTRPGDLVADAFVGGGTTLIEAWLLGRPSVGLDVSKLAIQTSRAKLREMEAFAQTDERVSLDPACRPLVLHRSALRLRTNLAKAGILQGQVKLGCAHPPYLNSLAYTGANRSDLSGIRDPKTFVRKMRSFARQMRQMLADDGILAVLIGDVRKDGSPVLLGDGTLHAFLRAGFHLESTVIKKQHRDRSSEFYYTRNGGSLLMAHEYLFILRNPKPESSPLPELQS